jgi:hypothetical protein
MYCQYCGVKLPDGARECDICEQPVSKQGGGTAVIVIVLMFIIVMGGIAWSRQRPIEANAAGEPATSPNEVAALLAQVNPAEGYQLPAVLGDLGPQLLAAGAIDYDRFVQTYERGGRPLSDAQLAILTEGSDEPLVINQENAHFLLNLFWAIGLTNQNPILTEGAMVQYGEGDISGFASTGGWTIGQLPATELYASQPLIPLTVEQQVLLERVAANVYRPCCNNPVSFPDCNHGMAMLGMLQLMAAQGATEDEMYEAAKYINAFWFPQQAMETAVYFQATMDLAYADVDGRLAVGSEVFSATGYQGMYQWLAEGGQLPQAPEGGPSCGVS